MPLQNLTRSLFCIWYWKKKGRVIVRISKGFSILLRSYRENRSPVFPFGKGEKRVEKGGMKYGNEAWVRDLQVQDLRVSND